MSGASLPLVSIVTVNYNGMAYLKKCLDSVYALDYPAAKLEIILVDNGSSDGSARFVSKNYSRVRVLTCGDNNYCKANNLALRAAKGEYVAFINNDVILDKGWLAGLLEPMLADGSVGASSGKIFFPDGTIQSAGHKELPGRVWKDIGFMEADRGQYDTPAEAESLCGCAVLYRKKCLDTAGFFDEDFVMFLEDVDMSVRCRAKGWKLRFCPTGRLVHHLHGTIGSEGKAAFWLERNRLLLIAKHWPGELSKIALDGIYCAREGKPGDPVRTDLPATLKAVIAKLFKEHPSGRASVLAADFISSASAEFERRIKDLRSDLDTALLRSASKGLEIELRLDKINELENKISSVIARRDKDIEDMKSSLAEYLREIDARDDHIRRIVDQMSGKDARLKELQSLLEEKDATIERRDVIIKDRDDCIKAREKTIEERDAGIKARESVIAERDAGIKNMAKMIAERDDRIITLNSEIKARGEEILKREKAIDQRDGLLRARDEALTRKDRAIAAAESRIAELESSLRDHATVISMHEYSIDRLNSRLRGIYESHGYRYILKPLWSAGWFIKQKISRGGSIAGKYSARARYFALKAFVPASASVKAFFSACRPLLRECAKKTSELRSIRIPGSAVRNRIKRFRFARLLAHSGNPFVFPLQKAFTKTDPWVSGFRRHINSGYMAPVPLTVNLMLTKRCNLQCKFCDLWHSDEEMSTESAFKVVDNVAGLKPVWFVITGGEPLMHKGLFDILDRARSRAMKTSITTNGSLIAANMEKIKKARIDVISVSLDGLNETHDGIRGRKGLYGSVQKAILDLKDIGQLMSINFVVTRENLNDLEPLYDWAQSIGVSFDFWPVNYHPELWLRTEDEFGSFFRFIDRLRREGKIPRSKLRYYTESVRYGRGKKTLKVKCLGLSRSLSVYVDGTLLPCCVWDHGSRQAGNAITDDIKQLWHSSRIRDIRKHLCTKGCSAGCYNSSLQEYSHITGDHFIVG